MTSHLTRNNKTLALLSAFLVLLGVNFFLQLDLAEELYNNTFASQAVTVEPLPEICGSRSQISSSIPCHASWSTLPSLIANSQQTVKLQYVFSFVNWASFEVPEAKLSLDTPPSFYNSILLFGPSGLAPPTV